MTGSALLAHGCHGDFVRFVEFVGDFFLWELWLGLVELRLLLGLVLALELGLDAMIPEYGYG